MYDFMQTEVRLMFRSNNRMGQRLHLSDAEHDMDFGTRQTIKGHNFLIIFDGNQPIKVTQIATFYNCGEQIKFLGALATIAQ